MGKMEAPLDGTKTVNHKLTSRKFWLTQQIVLLAIGVPILFQHLNIGESITMTVLGVVGGAGATYGVVNTLSKKWGDS